MIAPRTVEIPKSSLIPSTFELRARLGTSVENFGESFKAAEKEIISAMTPRAVYAEVDILREGNTLTLDRLVTDSLGLSRSLSGYDKAIMFAVTLGAGVDRVIATMAKISAERAFLLDGIASAYAEALIELAESEICKNKSHGKRYSIGYGDLPIEHQPTFLSILDAERKIGLYTLASCFMKPNKSITAIIGVS